MAWRLNGPGITIFGSLVGAAYGQFLAPWFGGWGAMTPAPFACAAFGFIVATALRLGIALDRTPNRIDTRWRLRHLFEVMILGAIFAAVIRGCVIESRNRLPENTSPLSLQPALENRNQLVAAINSYQTQGIAWRLPRC